MSDMSQPINVNQTNTPTPSHATVTSTSGSSWAGKAIFALALAVVFGVALYQSARLNGDLTSVRRELAQSQHQITDLQSQMGASAADARREAGESAAKLNEEIAKARKESQMYSIRAQAVAKQQAGKVMTDLSAKNTELVQQLDQLKQENTSKATEVDQALTGIKGDVGDVKTEVASTKADLDTTKTDLKRAVGDMGVMSGLIATNSSQLGELRKLGERNYIEFTLPKNGGPQKVGDIQIALKKTDLKRNRFTLDVLADDKRVEKRDKTINEPVQFYLASMRLPYEVVVNSVSKDGVKGYLSVPKVKLVAQR
jgi:hypothetical protein